MDSLGVAVFVTSVVLSSLATLAVAGRLYCKWLKKQRLLVDDWLIIFAWVVALSSSITMAWGAVDAGVGQPQATLPTDTATRYLKVLYIVEIFSTLSPGISKLSVLTFYRRIFTLPASNLAINIAIALAAAWTFAFTFGWLFDLIPLSFRLWLGPKRPDGRNVPIFVICMAVTGLFLDLVVVLLPLPALKRLHTTAVKVAYAVKWWQYNNNIGTADIGVAIRAAATEVLMWALIESNVAIMAACLPTLGPLFKKNRMLGRLIAGDSNVTSIGLGSRQPLAGHTADDRGGISVQQSFGTEIHSFATDDALHRHD